MLDLWYKRWTIVHGEKREEDTWRWREMDALEDHHMTKIISSDDSYFEMNERGNQWREIREEDRIRRRVCGRDTRKHKNTIIFEKEKVSFQYQHPFVSYSRRFYRVETIKKLGWRDVLREREAVLVVIAPLRGLYSCLFTVCASIGELIVEWDECQGTCWRLGSL